MGIRDEELKRLEAYAKALGVQKVMYSTKPSNNGAEWHTDGSQITLYVTKRLTKTALILNFIHELGHASHWINVGKKDHPDLITALNAEDARKANDPPIDKKLRKLIYYDEFAGTQYWDKIIKTVDIKINLEKINISKKIDLYIYRTYYETGNLPTRKELISFKKRLKNESKK